MIDIRTFLERFKLTSDEVDYVLSHCVRQEFKIGEQISSNSDTFFYVESGMIRSYLLIDGNDITYNFFVEGEICGDYESVLRKSPSKQHFQAITETTAYKFKFSAIESLFEENPRIERIARKISESAYIRLLDRVIEFQSESLEQRYLNLVDRHDSLLKDAPLQHIASYLGVKPQSLSRIRAKILNKR